MAKTHGQLSNISLRNGDLIFSLRNGIEQDCRFEKDDRIYEL